MNQTKKNFGSEIPNILMLSKFLKYPFAQNWSEIEFPAFWIQNQVKITISTTIYIDVFGEFHDATPKTPTYVYLKL